MDPIELLSQNTWLFLGIVFVLGLIVGSFLNVVIHRLPIMMERDWRRDCKELMGDETQEQDPERFDLVKPRSRCPHCGHQISALENIPVLSYLFLRGRCSGCQHPIGLRYPLVEFATACLSLITAAYFGVAWETAAALLLTWALIALSLIDFDVKLLPDSITLPFIWLGLLLSLGHRFTDPQSAIIGAVSGYLCLWAVYQLFKKLTGKEGMGYGDFKLLALFGAWLGWQYLPQILILSSVVGAVVGVSLVLMRGRDRNIPIPFGPYLATAGWISLLWGNEINQTYLRWSGLA